MHSKLGAAVLHSQPGEVHGYPELEAGEMGAFLEAATVKTYEVISSAKDTEEALQEVEGEDLAARLEEGPGNQTSIAKAGGNQRASSSKSVETVAFSPITGSQQGSLPAKSMLHPNSLLPTLSVPATLSRKIWGRIPPE